MAEVRDQEDLSSFVLSAFGDEIDDDVDTQLDVLGEFDIRCLEMRTAWGKKAAELNDLEIERLAMACRRRSIRVSCIGSRIGKSPITEPLGGDSGRAGAHPGSGRASGHETGADLFVSPPGRSGGRACRRVALAAESACGACRGPWLGSGDGERDRHGRRHPGAVPARCFRGSTARASGSSGTSATSPTAAWIARWTGAGRFSADTWRTCR